MADRLHSAAIHLLRHVRAEDVGTGLSTPRLSALSVIVFAGPISISALADAEQVRPPTISRLVKELEWQGLVARERDSEDRRVQRIRATAKGRKLLFEGKERRIARLASGIDQLTREERATVARAAAIIERLSLPPDHPEKQGGTTR
ncbi:MAG: MarR family transcriptional regulator [Gemmatimonadota bacterium]